MPKLPPGLLIGPLLVRRFSRDGAITFFTRGFAAKRKMALAFANTHLVAIAGKHVGLKKALEGFTLLNDGVGVNLAARVTYGKGFTSNLNGTDFVPALLRALPAPKVFLYGGRPGVALTASQQLVRHSKIKIAGIQDGYAPMREDTLVSKINQSGAEVVLVALGNPAQELWIARNRAKLKAPLCIAVGALFDFAAGRVKRAPVWMRRCRLEWFYRLLNEPLRLGYRYSIEIIYFGYIILRGRFFR